MTAWWLCTTDTMHTPRHLLQDFASFAGEFCHHARRQRALAPVIMLLTLSTRWTFSVRLRDSSRTFSALFPINRSAHAAANCV